MLTSHRDSRVVLLNSIGGLALIVVANGLAMSAFEGLSIREGMWMVFNVITTVGFGEGPSSIAGWLISASSFVAAAVCYFWITVVAVEEAMERFQHRALINEALRPLARRKLDRLHQDN